MIRYVTQGGNQNENVTFRYSLHSMSSRCMRSGYTTPPIDLVFHTAFQLGDVVKSYVV